jgi:hypothetical protein
MRQLNADPVRFADYLRANHISVADYNQNLDDTLQDPRNKGKTLDLTPGSDVAKAYGVGGAADGVSHTHLKAPGAAAAEASGKAALGDSMKIDSENVDNPGFFRAIADAIVEFVALLARAFGSTWNPKTITMNAAEIHDDFRRAGAKMVDAQGPALQAMLSTKEGVNAFKGQLLAHRPENVAKDMWPRLVEDMVAGAQARIDADKSLPPGLSPAEKTAALDYLRAHGFSADSNAKIRTVYAFPDPAVRKEALLMLPRLPETEANNMFTLFGPPAKDKPNGSDPLALRTYEAQTAFRDPAIGEHGRMAMFATLKGEGFRAEIGSLEVKGLTDAVSKAAVKNAEGKCAIEPAALRDQYMDLLPQFGLSRMAMVAGARPSVLDRCVDIKRVGGEDDARDFLAQLGKNVDSSTNLRFIIGTSEGFIRLIDPNIKALKPAQQKDVIDTFAQRKIQLRAQTQPPDSKEVLLTATGPKSDGVIDLSLYFKDPKYQKETLARLGMSKENFDSMLFNTAQSVKTGPPAVAPRLTAIVARLDTIDQKLATENPSPDDVRALNDEKQRLQIEQKQLMTIRDGTGLVTIDIRPDSETYDLFALGAGTKPVDPLQMMAYSLLKKRTDDDGKKIEEYKIKLDPGQPPISAWAFADMLKKGDAEKQFKAMYPKLDFRDTVLAFAYIAQARSVGAMKKDPEVDLTKKTGIDGLDAIRAKMSDKKDGNAAGEVPAFLRAAYSANEAVTRKDANAIIDRPPVAVFSPVDRFQYGYTDEQEMFETQKFAKQYQKANGGKAAPANLFKALFKMDDRVQVANATYGTTQNGQVTGNPTALLGVQAKDVLVVQAVGNDTRPGVQQDFLTGAKVFRETAEKQGGIKIDPRMVLDNKPDRDAVYGALKAQILAAKPGQVVLFAYSGHGAKTGIALGNGTELSSTDLAELQALATGNGVAFVVVSAACHSGERVQTARAAMLDRLEAAGQLPKQIRQLDNLRAGLIQYQEKFALVDGAKASEQMPGYPTPAQLKDLCAKALKDGPGSQAAQDLQKWRDKAAAERGDAYTKWDAMPNGTKAEQAAKDTAGARVVYLDNLMGLVDGVNQIAQAKTDLAASQPPLPNGILNNKVLTGDTKMGSTDKFVMNNLGPLSDRITQTMQDRMPANIDFGKGADGFFIDSTKGNV